MQTPVIRPADLPNFLRPPVNEVVLSVQFASLPAFRAIHAGLLWQRLRPRYPIVSEQLPLAAAFETFGGTPVPTLPFEIQAYLSPPMPRYWFEAEDGRELVQIQPDRIIHNWRKQEVDDEYPRYEAIRQRFATDVEMFGEFLASEGIGEVRPNQCEVTYLNMIELPEKQDIYKCLDRISTSWTGSFSEDYPLEFEQATLQSRFILSEGGTPYGRAYVSFLPALRQKENRRVIRLDITVRAKPSDDSIEAAFRMLDNEREIVVRTFAAVTTPEMWEYWGRTNGK
jgi:uncharacterized protein (TIGR04255 family)